MQERITDLVEKLDSWFVTNGKTLGLAESCTGGLISAFITERPGVSRFYRGTIVSYAAEAKEKLLEVPRTTIQAMGEVSLPVALHMARGAREALDCDWSVSVTGIAGPGGGSPDKPVGTVCFGVSGPGIERTEMRRFPYQSRRQVQFESAQFALEFLWNSIQS